MAQVKSYLSLIKFSHTIFAMPFAMIGFFLAVLQTDFIVRDNSISPFPGWRASGSLIHISPGLLWIRLLLVLACMITARSAAMAFNRYLDRSFDAKNPRTAIREIPAGIIKSNHALLFTVLSCVLFMVSCFFINRLCFFLAPVALFVVLGYSYTKRFTPLCHIVLGLGLSLAPIGAYLAVTGRFDWLPVLFSFTVLFWVSGFDIIYALQDEEFDKSQNLYSIPVAVGKRNALRVSEVMHALSALLVVAAGIYGGFGVWYWMGVCIFVGMLIYQHSIVKPDDLRKVNVAFMTANGIASAVFSVFVIGDIFLR
ncbi:UbiA-like polyprenyltransferase [Agriterribacter sp.]|uniref:UbiA-like polyprenyltransferase n=1 Tax=Agriterribacter sp. TaxID=2821509 RepID=UPI002C4CA875|nr:UbiA-like polyprenyltransferase [Agriterribacter sp.]HRP57526.1 UbiA-like polyprenyltransferase [Agriterribacter sp.]